jgi:hypothetical protein
MFSTNQARRMFMEKLANATKKSARPRLAAGEASRRSVSGASRARGNSTRTSSDSSPKTFATRS